MEQEDESYFIGEYSPDGKWACTFEDNGETGYMYLQPIDENGELLDIIDHLWDYNQISPPITSCKDVSIHWSKDATKVILIVDTHGWGMFDLNAWRKTEAPRVNGAIGTLPLEIWQNGINPDQGEPIKGGQ
jgi:hypothetical protein